MTPFDITPDFKSAWERFRAEMEWTSKTGHGPFQLQASREFQALAVLERMDQIQAFVTVTEMLKAGGRSSETSRMVESADGPWIVVDAAPSPLLYWCPVRGWMGKPDDAGVFLALDDARATAQEQRAYVMPLLSTGAFL